MLFSLRRSIPRFARTAVIRPFECHSRKREADAKRRSYRPHHGSRYLGSTPPTASMCNRHLEDTQTGPRGSHLHFEVPAVSHLAHAEPIEGLATDGAKSAHVGIGDA